MPEPTEGPIHTPPRMRGAPDGSYLLEFDRLTSTQDEARRRYLAGERSLVGVRAAYQSAGRGRRGARWEAPARKCLLITYILRGEACAPSGAVRLSLAVGVAVAEAVSEVCGLAPAVRWPNDVLIGDRKVAGVLVEAFREPAAGAPGSTPRAPEAGWVALVGIGVNVNNTETSPHLLHVATSLKAETRRTHSIPEIEAVVREKVKAVYRELSLDRFDGIVRRWLKADRTVGECFAASDGYDLTVGKAVGVMMSGALRLRLNTGEEIETMNARWTGQPAPPEGREAGRQV